MAVWRKRSSADEVKDPAGLIANLEKQVRAAKRVPLTDQVRLDKAPMQATLDDMRTTFASAGFSHALPLVDQMEEQLRSALPVPLTDQVRLPKANLEKIVGEMRASVLPTVN